MCIGMPFQICSKYACVSSLKSCLLPIMELSLILDGESHLGVASCMIYNTYINNCIYNVPTILYHTVPYCTTERIINHWSENKNWSQIDILIFTLRSAETNFCFLLLHFYLLCCSSKSAECLTVERNSRYPDPKTSAPPLPNPPILICYTNWHMQLSASTFTLQTL